MMVETMLESSQDFGMSNGGLPQWKRELLQRRAARSRPAPPAPAPPPRAPAVDDDEELRYGPGIVKRLKSRYLSLALRDAPRRRPSVLRRAASLEHLLDERPPPAPRPPAARARPASVAAPPAPAPAPARRDCVKRARSVDALSRLDARDDPPPASPSPPPPAPPAPPAPPPPPPAPRARPPRRPAPLLRDAERPPPDVVRAALRKFEGGPARRPARPPVAPRASTPEPRSPTPPRAEPTPALVPALVPTLAPAPALVPAPDEPEGATASACARPVSRAALEGIARAGSSVRFAFEASRPGSHLPPLAATNPVLVGRARRVGVIRPMPAPAPRSPEPPPEPCPKPAPVEPQPQPRPPSPSPSPLVNGHAGAAPSRLGGADVERAWSGSPARRPEGAAPRAGGGSPPGPRRARPTPAATSVVFNFSDRKEVPDYVENDGIVLRGCRRNRIKQVGEAGVVVLRAEALTVEATSDEEEGGPPSPCAVRFVNDNVLINGRSCMPVRPDRDRTAKLKLQFDDSLTRTFEYPSETSFVEEPTDAPAAPHIATLVANTHIASAALSRYTPSKTLADAFQLGVTRRHRAENGINGEAVAGAVAAAAAAAEAEAEAEAVAEAESGDVRPCGADVARAFSEARTTATDLLF